MDEIRKILNSPAGTELKEYLLGKVAELQNIENINEKSTATEQALEVKAQKRAYDKLKSIMDEIGIMSNKPTIKDPRDSYDVR